MPRGCLRTGCLPRGVSAQGSVCPVDSCLGGRGCLPKGDAPRGLSAWGGLPKGREGCLPG